MPNLSEYYIVYRIESLEREPNIHVSPRLGSPLSPDHSNVDRLGVPRWNSATGVLACVPRFSQLCVRSGVGFPVPTASRRKPSGGYVSKRLYHRDGPATEQRG